MNNALNEGADHHFRSTCIFTQLKDPREIVIRGQMPAFETCRLKTFLGKNECKMGIKHSIWRFSSYVECI